MLTKLITTIFLSLTSGITPASAVCRPPPPAHSSPPGRPHADFDTSGLTWTIFSDRKNSVLNSKQVKLRPMPGVPGGSMVVVDDTSPPLVATLRDGVLYSAAHDRAGKPYDLGPTGFLNASGTTGGSRIIKFEFGFGNASAPTFNASTARDGRPDAKWELASMADAVRLNHDFPGELMGFTACEQGEEGGSGPKGRWYRIYFMLSLLGLQWDMPGCETVAIRTTVKAT